MLTELDDITQRLNALPELQVLNYFWLTSRKGMDRLDLLKQLSAVTIDRPADWDQKAIRRAFTRLEHGSLYQTPCFVCRGLGRRLHRHHVIWIRNGGSNDPSNLVWVCTRCHGVVHPWMERTPTWRSKWFGMRETMVRVLDWLEGVTGGHR